jgi:hypothetical protein
VSVVLTLAQQTIDLSPDPSAAPGGEAIADLVRGLVFYAILACGAAAALGAGVWAISGIGTNPYGAMQGKRTVLIALAAAAIIGASGYLIEHFLGIGRSIN